MNADKINEIIKEKNNQLEYDAAQMAHKIINEIARLQQSKLESDKRMSELRAELKALEIEFIDAKSVLGE